MQQGRVVQEQKCLTYLFACDTVRFNVAIYSAPNTCRVWQALLPLIVRLGGEHGRHPAWILSTFSG